MRSESECRLVEAGRVVGVENVVLLHRVAAVERLDELLGGHRDAHIAIAERAGGTVIFALTVVLTILRCLLYMRLAAAFGLT